MKQATWATMAKKSLAGLLAAVTGLLLLGCASDGLETITVNEVTHSVFYAPQYAAMELGFFEEEGLRVDLVNGGGSDKSMTAVLSGDADIGLMGPETAVYVYNEGKEDHAVVIGQLTQRDGSFLVGRKDDPDFTWESLRGATIIGGRKGGMPLMTLEYVLRQKGLVPGEDVFVRTDIQFNLMAGAFEGSDADYVTLFEPTASLCEREGKGHLVAAVGAESGAVPFTAYLVKKSSLSEKTGLYQRYLNAVAKGQKWVAEHTPEEIAHVIAPQFPDSDEALLTAVAKNYQDIGAWCVSPVMAEEDFVRMQDIIETAGELAKRVPFAAIVDNSLAEKAR